MSKNDTSKYDHINDIPANQIVGVDDNQVPISVLWKKTCNQPIVEISLTNFWGSDLRWARELLDDPKQAQRVHLADLSYPIIVDNSEHPCLIWDGYHRIAKALLKGHKTIKAFILTPETERSVFLSDDNYRDLIREREMPRKHS